MDESKTQIFLPILCKMLWYYLIYKCSMCNITQLLSMHPIYKTKYFVLRITKWYIQISVWVCGLSLSWINIIGLFECKLPKNQFPIGLLFWKMTHFFLITLRLLSYIKLVDTQKKNQIQTSENKFIFRPVIEFRVDIIARFTQIVWVEFGNV